MKDKKIRKILLTALLLAALSVFGAVSVFAEDVDYQFDGTSIYSGSCGDQVNWEFDTDTGVMNITGTGAMWDDYYFGDFDLNPQEIDKVVIGEGITKIGSYSFSNATSIKEIELPQTLQSIGNYAFQYTEIDKFFLPRGISYLGKNAFSDLNNEYYTIYVLSDTYALEYVKKNDLNYVELQSGLSGEFGEGLHWTLDEGTLTISGQGPLPEFKENKDGELVTPWKSCSDQLIRVVIEDGITHISDQLFRNIPIREVEFKGTSLRSIGEYAFDDTAITSLELPEGLESIGDGAFRYTRLQSVTLPDSIRHLSPYCFSAIKELENIQLTPTMETIPEGAFQEAGALKEVVIPEGITTVGYQAFEDCYELESVTLPQSLKTIDDYAFTNCGALKKLDLPPALEKLGYESLNGCSLEEVNGLENVDYVGRNALGKGGFAENYLTPENDMIIIGKTLYSYTGSAGEFNVPEGIAAIGDMAFANVGPKAENEDIEETTNAQVTKVTIPDSVKFIGKGAFAGCTNMEGIVLPDGSTQIENHGFQNCKNLKDIDLPDALEYLGEYAFFGCGSLTSIDLPAGIKGLEPDVFEDCSKLTEVHVTTPLDYIYSDAFAGTGISELPLVSEKYNQICNRTFSDCKNLNNIVIPPSVESIEEMAFSGCKNLKTVTILDNVKVIERWAFDKKTLRTIKGFAGTAAEKYAKKNKIKFVKTTLPQYITTGQDAYDVMGMDEPFNLEAVVTNYDGSDEVGKLTYKTSNKKIVKVTADGTVKIQKAGKATVTVKAAAKGKYGAATKKVKIVITKSPQIITAGQESYEVVKGDPAFSLNASRVGNGKLTYKSSNTKIATVSKKGVVTIRKAGTVNITIKAAATGKCKAASLVVPVVINAQ
ncbi:MAG: leucine-rich repeat protein [Bacillota bacterium]|nr:leucine-rich repeat protein [Bacillota bacterium]